MESVLDNISEAFSSPAAPGWKKRIFDYTLPVPEPEPLVSIGGEMLVSRENLAIITGAPKACKSTFLATIAAVCLQGGEILNLTASRPLKCLYLDTEQSLYHLGYQIDRIFRLSGVEKVKNDNFVCLALRESSITERYEFLRDAIEELQPDIVLLDGAADLIADTNELEASEQLVAELLRLSSEFKCGIVSVIHSVPSQTKVRGHLGSTSQRKAETVIMLRREGMGSEIEVLPLECRNRPFKEFTCFISDNGDLEYHGPENQPQICEDWLLYLMEPHKEYTNAELVELVSTKGFKKSNIQYALNKALVKDRILKVGDKYTVALADKVSVVSDMVSEYEDNEEDI